MPMNYLIFSAVQENANLIMNMISWFGMSQYYSIHQEKAYTLDLAFSTLSKTCVCYVDSSDFLVHSDNSDDHHNHAFF